MTKRKEQAIRTKQTIYEAALDLMKTKSFKELTIEEISKHAGVSVGTIYHHFNSKEHMYIELFETIDSDLYNGFEPIQKFVSLEEEITDFFLKLAKSMEDFGLNITKYFVFSDASIFYRNDLYMNKALLKIVEKGHHNNELTSNLNVEEITEYLIVMARGVFLDWCVKEGSHSLSENIERYIRLILASVLKP